MYDSHVSEFRGNSHESSVVMIYGINHDNFNCTKIFNLLCGYGNVLKVIFKFMIIFCFNTFFIQGIIL